MNNSDSTNQMNEEINFKELLRPFAKNWRWFALTCVIFLILAFIFIRYTTPQYGIQSKLQIIQDQGSGSQLGVFRDLEFLTGTNQSIKVEDEIEILNSRANFINVVKELGLNTKIMAKGRIHDTELYNPPPIIINFLSPDSIVFKAKDDFTIRVVSETSFLVLNDDLLSGKECQFGSTISSGNMDFVITPNSENLKALINKEFGIVINPIEDVARAYKKKLEITISNELSNIIILEITDPVPQKGIDIVNLLIDTYNQNTLDERREVAERTSQFINDRITELYTELSSVESTAEEYKATRGITDVASQSNINLTLSASSRQELREAETQRYLASEMKTIIENQSDFEELPLNMGLSDVSIAQAVSNYNDLVRRRNTLLTSSNERNPIIVSLDQQLSSMKQSLQSSLAGVISSLTQRVNGISGQLARINSQIYSAPIQERAIRDIERERQTTEVVYQYLLQKREESQIAFASAPPKSKVIDRAHLLEPGPVSPKKPIILLASLIFGLSIPIAVIYLKQLLDTKIHNKIDLQKRVGKLPVLAELPVLGSKDKKMIKSQDRSVFAESLRILRTNLDYLIKSVGDNKDGKVVFVTSSVPGEGKTFIASNLAMVYAKANKKVLLIGGDIRNPKIDQFYSGKNVDKLKRVSGNNHNKGLTDYLSDDSITSRSITNTMLVSDQTVDIIHSGKLMPNPAELLMSERLKELVSEVKPAYDYIIVDTAPMVVVSDTMLITKFADFVLYVTRANYTDLNVLEFPIKMYEEGKIKNLSFVVNGVKGSNLGYGGKYGYGYGHVNKKWWKF
jgi:capsular exopolysaccharide synthesis family protein